jgi:hypothetical protein
MDIKTAITKSETMMHIHNMRSLSMVTDHAPQYLTSVVTELFADRPQFDMVLAIGAGHRALERGTPFFEAVEIAEGVMNLWEDMECRVRMYLIERRNYARLTAYRNKKHALLEL